jgi:chromosomal replication initiation ATPase DnaA
MNLETIIKNVSREFGLDIRTRSRKREYIYARAIYYKISREIYRKTLSEIGAGVNTNHATVLHSIKNVYPVIERFEPKVMESYFKLKDKVFFEAEQMNSNILSLEDAKTEIAELRYKLKIANMTADRAVNLGPFEDILAKVPQEKLEILKVRLDAMIKML